MNNKNDIHDSGKTLVGIPRPKRFTDIQLEKTEHSHSFKPCFYVLSEREGLREFPLQKDVVVMSFGRSEDCDVTIDDPLLSSTQLRAVRLLDSWYFIDSGVRDVIKVEGFATRQFISPLDTRILINCGRSWIVYLGLDCDNYKDTDSQVLRRSLINKMPVGRQIIDDALVTLRSGKMFRQTSFAPILVGSHRSCDFRLDKKGLNPFHFVLYWSQDGLFLEDLTFGSPGLTINQQKVYGPYLLKSDCTVKAGGQEFTLTLGGLLSEQCRRFSEIYMKKPRLCLTAIDGSMSPVLLPIAARDLRLGRDPSGHILLQHSSVSREHAHLSARDKSLMIEDKGSANGTYVNLEQVQRAVSHPGDIIEFGAVPFLLHYEENH